MIKQFITASGSTALTREAQSLTDKGHRSFNRTHVYVTADDPRQQCFDRSNAVIPTDNFAKDGSLRTIHECRGFDGFIQDCLQEKDFYRYADPLADVIITMAKAGNGFPWPFDTNNVTVTIALQNAEQGGDFEYAPGIRAEDENVAEVSKVLNGTSLRLKVLPLEPGDLQIFRSRSALHRIGTRPRFVAIFFRCGRAEHGRRQRADASMDERLALMGGPYRGLQR